MCLRCLAFSISSIVSLPALAQSPAQPTQTQTAPLQPPPSAPVTPYEPAPLQESLFACLACPAGTRCQNGACVPAPPPVCPAGFLIDGFGACVPGTNTPAALDADPEEARLQAERERQRMHARFTLDLDGAIGLMGDGPDPAVGPVGMVWAGIRHHYSLRSGLVARGGLAVGRLSYQSTHESTSTTDSTSLVGGMAEVMPFWLFGRFFLGPSAWLAYFAFEKSSLMSGTSTMGLNGNARVGGGFDCGFVLGDQENVVLSFPVRVSPLHGTTVLGSVAIGYQF